MIEPRYCSECNAELVIKYHIPDKKFLIRDGKIVRDDGWKNILLNQPELIFECSHDREHGVPIDNDKWEDLIREEFYEGAHYE
jgi:hypothetical protein